MTHGYIREYYFTLFCCVCNHFSYFGILDLFQIIGWSYRNLKIWIGVVPGRRQAGDGIGQNTLKAWPGFYPRIPVFS